MAELVVSEGSPVMVNLLESRKCCSCGKLIPKRKQMWKFLDGNYMCIFCKTHFDEEIAKGKTFNHPKTITG